MKVPFLDLRKQNMRFFDAFSSALGSVVSGPLLILGEEVNRFEHAWAKYCCKQFCVGVGNGYDALRILLTASGITSEHEVIVATNTHIATWLAVHSVGATIVPVEPHPRAGVLDAEFVSEAVTPRTKAILATNLYGQPVDVAGLRAALAKGGCESPRVLLDAAQGHGLSGTDLADGAAFSFYPTKNLGALGDGGSIVCDDVEVYSTAKALRNYGSLLQNEHFMLGENSRLDELQAAFLNVKLPLLNEANERRRRVAKRYCDAFLGLARLSYYYPGERSVFHQFIVRHRDRENFRRKLLDRGVGTLIHYPTPPHLQPAFMFMGFKSGDFPIAEKFAKEVVSLPIGPELTDDQVQWVIESVRMCA